MSSRTTDIEENAEDMQGAEREAAKQEKEALRKIKDLKLSKTSAEDDEEEEEDDEEEEDEEGDSQVELGFAVDERIVRKTLSQPNWPEWDGGIIGGRPIWLNPHNLPSEEQLTCAICGKRLLFVLQIYCPLDEIEGAFHRMLYVFACANEACIKQGGVKTFRCQLPRSNPFYDEDPEKSIEVWEKQKESDERPRRCALCHCRAKNHCASCKKVHYCSKEHQKEHWKAGHKAECQDTSVTEESQKTAKKVLSGSALSVFKSFDIFIEGEPETDEDERTKALLEKYQAEEAAGVEPEISELDLQQNELNKIMGINAKEDKVHVQFLHRIQRDSEQILRYARWGAGKPLWINAKEIPLEPEKDIPQCPLCGSKRDFEFQVMPQLLHFLEVEKKGLTMEWGVLAVYSCTKSCSLSQEEESHYIEEFVWRQSPPSLHQAKKPEKKQEGEGEA